MLNYAMTYAAHQRARWLRSDAARFLRPNAATSFKTDTDLPDIFPALVDHRIALEGLRCHLNQIKSDLAWRRLRDAIDRKYSANQPRVPAGSGRESGRWTSDDGGSSGTAAGDAGDGGMLDTIVVDGSEVDASGSGDDVTWDDRTGWLDNSTRDDERPTRVANDADPEIVRPGERYAQNIRSVTDANGNPYYAPGGHHEMPGGVFKKWNLDLETRRVFDSATTGPLEKGSGGPAAPRGHLWDGENGAHGQYNRAVEELGEDFMRRNGIRPEQMTPKHAEDLLAEIRRSDDPRIGDYNRAIRLLRRVFRFGRGE